MHEYRSRDHRCWRARWKEPRRADVTHFRPSNHPRALAIRKKTRSDNLIASSLNRLNAALRATVTDIRLLRALRVSRPYVYETVLGKNVYVMVKAGLRSVLDNNQAPLANCQPTITLEHLIHGKIFQNGAKVEENYNA